MKIWKCEIEILWNKYRQCFRRFTRHAHVSMSGSDVNLSKNQFSQVHLFISFFSFFSLGSSLTVKSQVCADVSPKLVLTDLLVFICIDCFSSFSSFPLEFFASELIHESESFSPLFSFQLTILILVEQVEDIISIDNDVLCVGDKILLDLDSTRELNGSSESEGFEHFLRRNFFKF